MHIFNYNIELDMEVLPMLTKLHEYIGRQNILVKANIDELNILANVARVQSIGASNRIEGIFTSNERLRALVEEKTVPQSRSEQEIAGYREVLKIIHENYEHINLNSNMILQLHRDLYAYAPGGGAFKNSDNVIAELDSEGRQITRFIPVPAFQTQECMSNLCLEFSKKFLKDNVENLLIIPMFIVDFLCIHPFNDGNGRMSRLLTLLLLYQAGYKVGSYISLEGIIENTKETYYEALQKSSIGWHDNKNVYWPFIKYFLGILLKAYAEFENRVSYFKKAKKSERIKLLIDRNIGSISKREIMEYYPDISKVTVERTLIDLVKNGYLKKVGNGKNTTYVKN